MKRLIALGALLVGVSLIVAPTAGATLVCPPGVTNEIYCAQVSPPTVVTGAANEVTHASPTLTTASATLMGWVNPDDAETTYYFQYGTTTAYGAQTAEGSLEASTTATAVQAMLTGLMPATTYHFRLVATNAGGSVVGADSTFTTPPLCTEFAPVTATNAAKAALTAITGARVGGLASTGEVHFSFASRTCGGYRLVVRVHDPRPGTHGRVMTVYDGTLIDHLTTIEAGRTKRITAKISAEGVAILQYAQAHEVSLRTLVITHVRPRDRKTSVEVINGILLR